MELLPWARMTLAFHYKTSASEAATKINPASSQGCTELRTESQASKGFALYSGNNGQPLKSYEPGVF